MLQTFVYLIFMFRSITAYTSSGSNGNRCSDCVLVTDCADALAVAQHENQQSQEKLRRAICGRNDGGLPMICCSDFETVSRIGVDGGSPGADDGVDSHQNLRLLPTQCGDIAEDRKAGGKDAGLYEFPWIVLIAYSTRTGPQFQCDGSLISDRYVLTAAHCIKDLKIAGVRIGEYDVRTKTDCQGTYPTIACETYLEDVAVEKATPHPQYHGKPNVINDIGLIRLKEPVDFTKRNVDAVCLPVTQSLRTRDVSGQLATVAGWGYTEFGYMSPHLLKVNVPVHTRAACRGFYNSPPDKNLQTFETALCAGVVGKDACNGDSGGPLMVQGSHNGKTRNIQYGIVSYGPTACGNNTPGVYTDVSKYMKWILDNLQP